MLPDITKLDLAVTKAPKRVAGRLPMNVPITSMGLTKDGAAALTPAAAKLSKSDLVLLQHDVNAAKELGLTAKDVNSIRTAFARPIDVAVGSKLSGADISVSCCCCTPCCCAAAALEAQRPVA